MSGSKGSTLWTSFGGAWSVTIGLMWWCWRWVGMRSALQGGISEYTLCGCVWPRQNLSDVSSCDETNKSIHNCPKVRPIRIKYEQLLLFFSFLPVRAKPPCVFVVVCACGIETLIFFHYPTPLPSPRGVRWWIKPLGFFVDFRSLVTDYPAISSLGFV